MSLFPHLRRRLTPPYSLNTIILVVTSAVVVVLAALYSAFAYERLGRETMDAARHWSDSVARLVGSSNTNAFILDDIAAIESNLQQIVQLPGIDDISVFREDGRILVQVRKAEGKLLSEVGGTERITPPPPSIRSMPGRGAGDVYESWSTIDISASSPLAWIRVHFSLNQRTQELKRLWLESLLGTLLIVGLMLISLHVILRWALQPIHVLSAFAEKMSEDIGSRVELASTCQEATQLSQALNQASRGMAEQVARVQSILITAADAIIGIDAQGMVSSANPAASSIFGRPEEDILGQPLEQCVPGLSLDLLREFFGEGQTYYGGPRRIVRHDFFGTRADSTPFPVEISMGEVLENDRLRYACIVRDVTDERAAQETSELYERALACSHNAVFITNAKLANQPIVYVNESFQQVTGLPPHKVLGRNLDLLRGTDRHDPAIIELTRAVQEQRNASVTLQHTLESGKHLVAEVSLSPVLSSQGFLTHFVGIVSDVTARVQAEQAIAERSAQLDAIFSLSPDGFVLFDAQDQLVFANPAFERMTGLAWMNIAEPMTLAGFESFLSDVCHADHPLPHIRDMGANGEMWQARMQLVRPQHRVVQAQSRRNVTGRGETILYFRDVTHEDEVDRMKSEFLASAAHELRTPMVSIFGFTELLLKRKYPQERQADMLQTIHRQSGLLVKMINELLDLARIESRGGLDLQIAEHPLRELVDNSVKGLMRKDTDRQVTIRPIPDLSVMIDPEKMQLALNNLLTNAFKYSPQGGTVSLGARIETQDQEHFAVIEIQDQGIGMSADQLARAFERFYRADASGNIPGTGLGLSLVKEVAELHKGRVKLASQFGQGTLARLWIPLPVSKAPGQGMEIGLYSI